jgi:hypothetical protein
MFITGLRFLCVWQASQGVQEANIYTINHLSYNLVVFDFLLGMIFLMWLFVTLLENPVCGNDHNSACNKVLRGLFILLRSLLVFTLFLFFFGEILRIDWITISITYKNWWQRKDEKFKTNVSWFNAGMCWILWLLVLSSYVFQISALLATLLESCKSCRMARISAENLITMILEYILTKEGFI